MHTVEALDSLILFRQKPDSLLRRLMATEEAVRVAAQGELVALAVENGWQGDLWRCCIARELVSSENPFSLTWERHSGGQDTLEALALADMKLFFELLNAPPEGRAWPLLRNFRHESRRTADCASFLAFSGELAAAGSPEGLLDRLTAFYQTRGVGLLGMGQVFRARRTGDGAELVSVEDRPPVRLADLVGYRQQKDLLIRNTEAFLRGKGSNNVLLYGDAGTGKSTSIQALVNEYADQGLRLIELYKEQYDLIPDILRQVKGRNYRFLLFLDDLSFEENETSYKYLKAVMEGGAEAPPENVRICATSNRRHLIKETLSDRSGDDIHEADTRQELMSLSARFGLTVTFQRPDKVRFEEILLDLAKQYGVQMPSDQLFIKGEAFAIRAGGRSPRVARQFIELLSAGVRL